MHLKSFIIGLFLFCAGGGTLWWVVSERRLQEQEAAKYRLKYGSETSEYIKLYEEWMLLPAEERTVLPAGLDLNGNKSPEQIIQEQQERLKADMDKLAAGGMTAYPFVDEFYGRNWREKIVENKKQKEQREFLYNISIACASAGGLLTVWTILLSIARVFIKIISKLKNAVFPGNRKDEQTENQENDNAREENKNENDKSPQDKSEETQQDFKDLPNVLVNSGWQYAGSFGSEQKSGLRQRKRIPAKSRLQNENINNENPKELQETNPAIKAEDTQRKNEEKKEIISPEVKKESEKVAAHNVDLAHTKGHTNQIDNTLKDLTQQVSAIREYAANQQNRLERYQDGYDWNIIKTFCLRIIRCIDNIETRMENLPEEDNQAAHLEEVHDELVFALESSGIEQFEPEVNSDYRGQEKSAEAIKERTKCQDPDKKGKIEKVLKPGYQFYIDEENVKIVRPAQVRLYA
ncbi:MAG: nucleotide exchange factor GrpE [Sedimentisphaerales bacterium]|nr:nucleotide exchange factor GrpE [Sedimentisphaerales bacterium]